MTKLKPFLGLAQLSEIFFIFYLVGLSKGCIENMSLIIAQVRRDFSDHLLLSFSLVKQNNYIGIPINNNIWWSSFPPTYAIMRQCAAFQLAWASLKSHQILSNWPRVLLHLLLCVSECLSVCQTTKDKLKKGNVEYLSNHWSDLIQIWNIGWEGQAKSYGG